MLKKKSYRNVLGSSTIITSLNELYYRWRLDIITAHGGSRLCNIRRLRKMNKICVTKKRKFDGKS